MQSVPEKETMDAIAELFKGFADSTRVHILALLSRQELIKFRREGKNILYSLADDHVKTILQMGLEHVLE